MIRSIVLAIAASAILAGGAFAHIPLYRLATNGTHLDGLPTSVSAGAVGAVLLPTGATVMVR